VASLKGRSLKGFFTIRQRKSSKLVDLKLALKGDES
jgi:hypothetical protein